MAKKQTRKITAADRRAAERLSAIWHREKNERKFTQDDAAEALGVTQPMVSQYLHATAALGIKATLKFAAFLNCHPGDIRDDLDELGLAPGELSPDAIALAVHWQEHLPDDAKEAVRRLVFSYPPRSGRGSTEPPLASGY